MFEDEQKELCNKYGFDFTYCTPDELIGISRNLNSGKMPINGMRYLKSGNTSGWYVWAGKEEDFVNTDDWFEPIHIKHLIESNALFLKFLGLPAGTRFLVDNKGYEDIWKDESLLIT